MASLPDGSVLARLAEILGLLGNATRLNILLALHSRSSRRPPELCVCDLAIVARASKSMTSHQLRLLRTAGLVRQRRAGKLVYYSLAEGPLSSLLDWAVQFPRSETPADGRTHSKRLRPDDKRGRA